MVITSLLDADYYLPFLFLSAALFVGLRLIGSVMFLIKMISWQYIWVPLRHMCCSSYYSDDSSDPNKQYGADQQHMQPLLPGEDFTTETCLPGNHWAPRDEYNPTEAMATQQPWQLNRGVGGGPGNGGKKRGHAAGKNDEMETQHLLDVDDGDGEDSDSAMV